MAVKQKACKKCDKPVEAIFAKESYEKYGEVFCMECQAKLESDEPDEPSTFENAQPLFSRDVKDQSFNVEGQPDTCEVLGARDTIMKTIKDAESAPSAPHEEVTVDAGFDIVDDYECTVTHYQQKPITKYTDAQIETIKNTVAKGITTHELGMFMHLCKVYGLDPFLKEIFYSAQMKTIMTSRDGYLKVAQRDPTFDGIQSMAVCENDEFEIDAVTPTVKHVFGKGDRGKVVGAWAIVHKKGRRAVISYADLGEYKKDTSVWKSYPSAMICKVAEVFSLKRQFGISGLVTQEELE